MMYGREKAGEYKNTFVKIQGTGTNFFEKNREKFEELEDFFDMDRDWEFGFLNVITGITVI